MTTVGGRVVVVGNGRTDSLDQAILLGLPADGSLDPAFGTAGVARRDFPRGASGQLLDVIVDISGRLVVAGVVNF